MKNEGEIEVELRGNLRKIGTFVGKKREFEVKIEGE